MAEEQTTVMTVDEIAEYLRIPRSSVYKMAQEGKIPCRKAGRRWRFHREAIDQWLSGGGNTTLNDTVSKTKQLPESAL